MDYILTKLSLNAKSPEEKLLDAEKDGILKRLSKLQDHQISLTKEEIHNLSHSDSDRLFAHTAEDNFSETENYHRISVETVSESVPFLQNEYVKIVNNLLSLEECESLIKFNELVGFERAMLNMGAGRQIVHDSRDHFRCIIESKLMANLLFKRLKEFLPREFKRPASQTWVLDSVNPRLRVLRYEKGEKFKPHKDGTFAQTKSNGVYEQSFVTIQLYLNDVPRELGGATRFLNMKSRKDTMNKDVFDCNPEMGKVLLFHHPILHEGSALMEDGIKYTIRTDVMYIKEEDVEKNTYPTSNYNSFEDTSVKHITYAYSHLDGKTRDIMGIKVLSMKEKY